MTDENISKARAFIVVNVLTRERMSHELPTFEEGQQFIEQIRHAKGEGFEVVPIK